MERGPQRALFYCLISDLAQQHALDRMIGALRQHDMGTFTRRQDVVAQIHAVDLGPDAMSRRARLVGPEILEMVEVGGRLLEDGPLQQQEALEVPGFDIRRARVEVDREVEEIRQDYRGRPTAGAARQA